MLASLVLGSAVLAPAAPVPRDAVPPPAGPAPKVVVLRADPAGQVVVAGVIVEKKKVTHKLSTVVNGQITTRDVEREMPVRTEVRKPLADLGDAFATAGGRKLTADEVARRVRDGAAVLAAADGKPVHAGWLRAVDPETVVLTSPALANVQYTLPQGVTAPRLLMLAPGPDGRVEVAVTPAAPSRASGLILQGGVVVNGPGVVQFEVADGPAAPARPSGKKRLEDVAFDAYTTDGVRVDRAEALDRLRAGGLVLVSGDTRAPESAYLKPFRRDLLVLVSAELTPADATRPGVYSTFNRANGVQVQIQAAPLVAAPPVVVRPPLAKPAPAPAPAPNAAPPANPKR